MGKLFLLGIILAVIIGIALIPYIKWILLFLAIKVVIELIIKFRATRKPKVKHNPLEMMKMGVSSIGNRVEQGFDTPRIQLSKVLMYVLGLVAVIIIGKFGIDLLLNIVDKFKYLLLLLLLLVALLLISKAKQGKPITMRKIARRASNIKPKRNVDEIYDDGYPNEYDEREEYSYNTGYKDTYRGNRRYSYNGGVYRQEYNYDNDDACINCSYRRYCDEDRRRQCSSIRPKHSRNKRMDYI